MVLIQDVRPGDMFEDKNTEIAKRILSPCDRNHVHVELTSGVGCWDRNYPVKVKGNLYGVRSNG